MRRHLVNGSYGVPDYGSYPLGMLLVAPLVLHRPGAAQYGVWMISTAVASAGGIIASGFCDAIIHRVARLRGTREVDSMVNAVRSTMGVNMVLGLVLAIGGWIAAPLAAVHATQAMGLVRTVAHMSPGGRAAVLFPMIYLLRQMGIQGLAITRVWYGAIALIVYLPLAYELGMGRKKAAGSLSLATDRELAGGSTL